MRIDQFTEWPMAHDVVVRPDGGEVVFAVTRANQAANRYDTCLWRYRPSDGDLRRLTSGTSDTGAVYLPDSSGLFFRSNREASEAAGSTAAAGSAGAKGAAKASPATRYYFLSREGGEAEPAFALDLAVTRFQPLDAHRALVQGHYDFARDADWTEIESLPFYANGSGYVDRNFDALYLLDLDRARDALSMPCGRPLPGDAEAPHSPISAGSGQGNVPAASTDPTSPFASTQLTKEQAAERDAARGLTRLSSKDLAVSDFALAADGHTVFLTGQTLGWMTDGDAPMAGATDWREQVFVLDLPSGDAASGGEMGNHSVTGKARAVCAPQSIGGIFAPMWAEPGEAPWAAVLHTDAARYGVNENYQISRVTADGLEAWSRPEFDVSIGSSVGSDARYGKGRFAKMVGDNFLFLETRGTRALVCALQDGASVPVELGAEALDVETVECFDGAGDGLLYYLAMGQQHLAELYVFDGRTSRRLTDFSAALRDEDGVLPVEEFEYESNGATLHGFVVLPPEAQAGAAARAAAGMQAGGDDAVTAESSPEKSLPALLWIHGGPKTTLGKTLFHEIQWLARLGYVVFYTNPHGADGYGAAFADIRGKYGTVDFEDLMTFTDEVLARYPQVDPARVGVLGGSYGGFMTNWIVGHTDRFAAANAQRSISNWVSFYGVSDIGWMFSEDQTQSSPWTSPEKSWEQSPLKYADRVTTPTLFIHADHDFRCPLEQGVQMYARLKKNGVPSRLVIFKDETHELSRSGRPNGRLKRLSEIADWFGRYLRPAGAQVAAGTRSARAAETGLDAGPEGRKE